MAMNTARAIDHIATAAYAHLFATLSDPARLAILQHLSYGEHRVKDLVDHMDYAQSTVSKHLRYLSDCGLVAMRSEGRSSIYSLAEPDRLAGLLKAAQKILEATGRAATLCPHLMNPQGE